MEDFVNDTRCSAIRERSILHIVPFCKINQVDAIQVHVIIKNNK